MAGGKYNRRNFFSDNIAKSGEGFLEAMDAKSLRIVSKRVFNDIAKGNIDFDKYWTYFTIPMFIDALVDVSYTNMLIHTTDMNMYMTACNQIGTNSDTEAMLRYHRRLSEAYTIIFNAFNNLKCNSYQVDVSQLKIMSNRLREYSHDLMDPIFSVNAIPPSVKVNQPPKYIDLMAPVEEPEQVIKEEEFYPELTLKPEKDNDTFFPTFSYFSEENN